MFSIADLPFYIPTNNGQGFLFLSLTHVILKKKTTTAAILTTLKLPISIILEVLASAVRPDKEMKDFQKKERIKIICFANNKNLY